MLDFQQLRYFIAVAEAENVSRAALTLNVTQSPLSRQIQALEASLGVTLFVRSKRRLKLTAAGRDLLSEANKLIDRSAILERKFRAISEGREGTLVVGCVDGAIHSGVLARALKLMRNSAPRIDIDLRVMRSSEQHRQLLNRTIDVGLAHTQPPPGQFLNSRAVFSEAFRLAVPTEYGWKRPPTAPQVDGKDFIAPPLSSNAAARHELLRHCEAAGFRPNIRYEAASPLTALELVSAGLGMALVQESLERIKPDGVLFVGVPKGFRLKMPIYAVRHADCPPLATHFFSKIAELRSAKNQI